MKKLTRRKRYGINSKSMNVIYIYFKVVCVYIKISGKVDKKKKVWNQFEIYERNIYIYFKVVCVYKNKWKIDRNNFDRKKVESRRVEGKSIESIRNL